MNKILVIGGAGFVGRHIVARLVGQGFRVTVPTRHRARAGHLILLPTIEVVESHVGSDDALDALLRGHDAVINLVGILQGSRGTPYGREFARARLRQQRGPVAGGGAVRRRKAALRDVRVCLPRPCW